MSTTDKFAILKVALTAAIEAGDYFHSRLDTELEVKTKSSPSDLVTDVDPKCEEMIRNRVLEAFPEHKLLGEETTAPGREASLAAITEMRETDHLWIVDPLDGTTNFVAGLPLSVVSIAYAEEGIVQAGVIYEPYRGEIFFAVRGRGGRRAIKQDVEGWLQEMGQELPGVRLEVSKAANLRRCVAATGLPVRSAKREQLTQMAMNVALEVKSLRALGAAALHLAYVASGKLDAFWEYDLNAWDLAAGVFLVEEAGGIVRSMSGEEYQLMTRDVVVAGTSEIVQAISSHFDCEEAK